MEKVIVSISISLDGFLAGPSISVDNPLGEGGDEVHKWMFLTKTKTDEKILNGIFESTGAVIAGGHTYKTAISKGWGNSNPFAVPVYVITHQIPKKRVKGFTYITEGIKKALAEAKVTAGTKNVLVMGGADIVQQYLNAGLVDELNIQLVDIFLGRGTRLFDNINTDKIKLEQVTSVASTGVTHLMYKIRLV
jgi:dihydrofolate reductase